MTKRNERQAGKSSRQTRSTEKRVSPVIRKPDRFSGQIRAGNPVEKCRPAK